jgi:putative ABC transport system substrate-binding protein
MRRRAFLAGSLGLLAAPLGAQAQPARRVPRVGILTLTPLGSMMFPRQFPDALRDLGYVEQQDIILDWHSADGRPERLAGLAAELVRGKVDVIVAISNADILAAKRATATIPIVMAAASDPVGDGFVASLARPGGNITGRTFASPELVGKQIEILKEAVPTIARLVYFRGDDVSGAFSTTHRGVQAAAQALGLTLHAVEVRQVDDVARVLDEVRRWRPDAFYVVPNVPGGHRDAILRFAVQHRLPAMSQVRGMTEAGALMVYAPSAVEAARRVAYYVDRILRGARPADLPVEQPQKFDLVINLRTAKRSG